MDKADFSTDKLPEQGRPENVSVYQVPRGAPAEEPAMHKGFNAHLGQTVGQIAPLRANHQRLDHSTIYSLQ
jgi:hypothetical protein